MVAFAKTAFAALTLFTSLVSADCAFNIININGAVMGTGCARRGGQGTLRLPDFGSVNYIVSATVSCGLAIIDRQGSFPPGVFAGWTVGNAGECTLPVPPRGGGRGGGGGAVGGGGVVKNIPKGWTPFGGGVLPPTGNSYGRGGKSNARKCDRERCSGPQGCCTQPVLGACPARKQCNNYPCDSCCGIPTIAHCA